MAAVTRLGLYGGSRTPYGVTPSAIEGTPIVNPHAGPIDPQYEICQRSGFKFPRGTLVQEWTGAWIAPKFAEPRNAQDLVRDKAELLEGSIRPEPNNRCVEDEFPNGVKASDL